MTLEEGFFYPTLALPLKHVLFYQKERMLSSRPVLEEVAEDWDCLDCGGGPPPDFHLPPPPCPPDLDVPWTCPAASRGGGLGAPAAGDDRRVSIAVVVVTAATFVLLAVVAAVIVCRRRLQRENRGSKSAPTDGAVIYDDLTGQSVPPGTLTTIDEAGRTHQVLWTPLGPRSPPRYVHAPSLSRLAHHHPPVRYKMSGGEQREDHLRQHGIGHPIAEPLYQTISSGSGSSQCPSEGGRMPASSPSPRPHQETESEEDDSLTPFLKRGSVPGDDSPLRSPCHARYYLSVPLGHPLRPPSASSSTHTSSHEYETLPLRSGMNGRASIGSQGRPLTPQERGLPPLPSRSERFRMFLPQEKGKEKRPVNSRTPQGFVQLKRPANSAGDVIYENIGLSSHL